MLPPGSDPSALQAALRLGLLREALRRGLLTEAQFLLLSPLP